MSLLRYPRPSHQRGYSDPNEFLIQIPRNTDTGKYWKYSKTFEHEKEIYKVLHREEYRKIQQIIDNPNSNIEIVIIHGKEV